MYLTQFWDQRPIPQEIDLLIESFRRLNPGLQHRCFDADEAAEFIRMHFSRRELDAFRACAVPAMQADYFRYCALLVDGGFYVDADFRCLVPVSGLLPSNSEAALVQRPNGIVINGFMGFRNARHPLLKAVLEIATLAIEGRLFGNDIWLTTGPGILTFLWVISASNEQERAELYAEGEPADERVRCIRLCRDIALRDLGTVDGIFANVHLVAYDDLLKSVEEADVGYKRTARHWPHWEGSIFASL